MAAMFLEEAKMEDGQGMAKDFSCQNRKRVLNFCYTEEKRVARFSNSLDMRRKTQKQQR